LKIGKLKIKKLKKLKKLKNRGGEWAAQARRGSTQAGGPGIGAGGPHVDSYCNPD